MTDQTAHQTAPAEEVAQDSAAVSEQLASDDRSATLEREHVETKDRLLRALAEMENLRKRTEREVADSRLYSFTSFARDLLIVADNMRRALEAVTPELRASAETAVKSLIEGVELTERELLKALEKNGVRQFTPQGQKFDPNVHQAMFEIPDASVPAGSVVQVVQPGYMIGDRVLRPALVGVSKGGPKTAPAAGNDNSNNKKPKGPADKN
jgi:molecular chaperone GrpE